MAHVEVGVGFGFLVRVEDSGAWAADVGGTGEVVFAAEACLCWGRDEEAALVQSGDVGAVLLIRFEFVWSRHLT